VAKIASSAHIISHRKNIKQILPVIKNFVNGFL